MAFVPPFATVPLVLDDEEPPTDDVPPMTVTLEDDVNAPPVELAPPDTALPPLLLNAD
jgi:hypothetical protein